MLSFTLNENSLLWVHRLLCIYLWIYQNVTDQYPFCHKEFNLHVCVLRCVRHPRTWCDPGVEPCRQWWSLRTPQTPRTCQPGSLNPSAPTDLSVDMCTNKKQIKQLQTSFLKDPSVTLPRSSLSIKAKAYMLTCSYCNGSALTLTC